MIIESRSNPLIKRLRALSASKERRAQGTHLLEGEKLVRDAIASGAPVVTLVVEEGFDPARVGSVPEERRVRVTRSVLEAITDSKTPQGVAAEIRTPTESLPERYPAGLVVLLDGVQDPGNLGAILRSADAFGAGGVLLSPGCADPFSPKALRAAMGSTYHMPVWQGDMETALDRLMEQGFTPLCGHLKGTETLPPLGGNVALVIGSEGAGVTEAVACKCKLYRLPMYGKAESLNAAVAAGVLLYAVRREMEKR